jgi:hypothetical protein
MGRTPSTPQRRLMMRKVANDAIYPIRLACLHGPDSNYGVARNCQTNRAAGILKCSRFSN